MATLRETMKECQDDTERILGAAQARRLSNWQKRQTDVELVEYIKRLIRGTSNQNGFLIHREKGLSLEGIVLDRFPHLFNADDKLIAAKTLGRSA